MKLAIIGTGFVMAAALAGCAVEDTSEVAATAEAAQAVSAFGIWSWGCSSSPCSLDLGTATNRVCFLAGVWGNLQHAGTYSQVDVVRAPNISGQLHWGLQIQPNGQPLGGTAVCIPGTVAATGTWNSGAAELNLGAGNTTRRCFLSSVRNTNGFTSVNDYVQVRKVSGSWFLGGNQVGKDTQASAVCVDVPTAAFDFGWVLSDGFSSFNVPIQSNNPGGWACGLKKLGGHFTANDYNDGVWIDYNSGISEWELNVVNGKQVTTDCVN